MGGTDTDALSSLASRLARLDKQLGPDEKAQVVEASGGARLSDICADIVEALDPDYQIAEARRSCEVPADETPTDKGDKWKGKYKEPVVPDITDLGELPEGWCWATLDEVMSRITSGSRDWTQYYGRGDSTFLMAQNVRPGRLDLAHKQVVDPPPHDSSRERSQVQIHDLLVTIVGANTGNVCRVPTDLPRHYVCQSVALLRPVDPSSSHYIDLFLNSPPGQQTFATFMYGQGRPHLSFDNLRETPIPLPPSREQGRICDAVERQLSVVHGACFSISNEIGRLTRLRQSILKWAFEGNLVDQDPSDEPASRLLERINAERASRDGKRARKPELRRPGSADATG